MHSDQLLNGRYRLVEHLGVGGMSVVWRARDQVLNRDVAVKLLTRVDATDPEARGRMLVEAQVCAHLWHPNIASVYDYGESPGADGGQVPYLVMELLPGLTLGQRLAQGPLPAQEGLRICAEVAAGLAAAHAQDIVHRDVKPGNVVLTPSGAKIVDFGIAAIAGQPEVEVDGELLGTPTYVAPERLAREAVTPASDVYALGVLLHRVLTRRLPWLADTPSQLVNAHVFVEAAPLPPLADVPLPVARICDRCLDKDPDRRPSAAEVADVLAEAVRPTPAAAGAGAGAGAAMVAPAVVVDRPVEATGQLQPAGRRRRSLVLVTVVMLLVLVGLAGLVALVRPGGRPDPLAADDRAGPTGTATAANPTDGPASAGPTVDQPVDAPVSAPVDVPVVAGPPVVPSPTADGPGPPLGTSVRAKGGEISVQCEANLAEVLAIEPAPGYQVKTANRGPASEIRVVLHSAGNDSDIRVRCVAGSPRPDVKESKNGP